MKFSRAEIIQNLSKQWYVSGNIYLSTVTELVRRKENRSASDLNMVFPFFFFLLFPVSSFSKLSARKSSRRAMIAVEKLVSSVQEKGSESKTTNDHFRNEIVFPFYFF